jgi:hypothetical protein
LDTASNRLQRQYKGFLYDFPSAARVVFLNEFVASISGNQGGDELYEKYSNRLFISACNYLSDILGCHVVVLISDELDSINCGFFTPEISVVPICSFLQSSHDLGRANILVEAEEIRDNLKRNRDAQAKADSQQHALLDGSAMAIATLHRSSFYSPHIPTTSIAEGLAIGKYIRGKFNVYRHNNLEAEVQDASGKSQAGVIVISGRQDMNRAMEGDEVIVQVYPRDKW